MCGAAAHVGDGPLQKIGKKFFFIRCKIPDQLLLNVCNGLVHGLMALMALWLDVDPFAAPIVGIGPELDKPLLLQPGEKSGNGGMAQVEGFFQIPGTGRLFLPGKKSHDMSLGSGELHFFQRRRHGLVGTPMQDTGIMTVILLQNDHLLKCSKLRNYITTAPIRMQDLWEIVYNCSGMQKN